MRRLFHIVGLCALAALVACGGPASSPFSQNLLPRARLSAPLSVAAGEPVLFDAGASYDPDGTVVDYTFFFSDGVRATLPTPEIFHTFDAPGAYEVTVVVRDDGGLLAKATQIVVVRADAALCRAASDCPIGAECRDDLCYSPGSEAGSTVAECLVASDCGGGFTCRAGLCLSVRGATLP